jgi:hypothetical protein
VNSKISGKNSGWFAMNTETLDPGVQRASYSISIVHYSSRYPTRQYNKGRTHADDSVPQQGDFKE